MDDEIDDTMSGGVQAVEIGALYEGMAPELRRFFRAWRVDGAAAEDLVQEVFHEAVKHAERVAGAVSPRAYLYGIARNLRRGVVRRKRLNTVGLEAADGAMVEAAEEDGRLGMVREVLGRMPEVQREVLELRVKCGLSYAEVAGVLGIPLGTVRSRIHAAVAALRERVIEEEGR